jgi:hypothetical protein
MFERDTGLEPDQKTCTLASKTSSIGDPPPPPDDGTVRTSTGLARASKDLAIRNPEPLTVEVLRRKLDAAIVAEAWDAVKAIRERIVEAEREAAGNVVPFDATKRLGR